MGRETAESLEQLERLGQQVQQWRETRPYRCAAMPEELWQQAAEMTRRLGVTRVSSTLKVSYQKLKDKAQQGEQAGQEPSPSPGTPGFVELAPLARPFRQASHTMELQLQGPHGLSLRLQGDTDALPLLHHLVEAFCRGAGS